MQVTMILLRFFHIVSGVLWVGGVAMTAVFLLPALRGAGPGGRAVLRELLTRTRFAPYFPVLGGLTVLSGIWMFWQDGTKTQGGFAAFSSSPMGITLSIGALAGLVALIMGGAVIGRAVAEVAKILGAIDSSGGESSSEQGTRMALLQGKIAWGSRIVLPLLIIAATAMAVARYV